MSMGRAASTHRLPLWLKLIYTAFVAVLVPVYWMSYGPTNFLYFCDLALLMTLAAVWLENALLASAALVGIFLVQMLWVGDFFSVLIGHPIIGMTAYMFDTNLPFYTRALSFFHFWLPFFLLAVAWRLGYDRRAFALWTGLALVVLLICYFVMPPPPAPTGQPNLPVNINYVYGLNDAQPQQWMDGRLYFVLLLLVLPLGILLPSHLLFRALLPAAPGTPVRRAATAALPQET